MTRGSAIGVVDYGMGNLRSVSKALESLGFPTLVSGDPEALSPCRGIVFPGVGAFRDCMGNVVRQGLLPFLREYLASDRPFLGICVGMQLLFSGSEEFGRHEGIDFFRGNVVRFPGDMPARDGGVLKVPHMGWNTVAWRREHPEIGTADIARPSALNTASTVWCALEPYATFTCRQTPDDWANARRNSSTSSTSNVPTFSFPRGEL